MFDLHVSVHMKSGKTILVKCKKVDTTQSPSGNFTGIVFKGIKNCAGISMDINQIEAVTTTRRWFFR